MYAIECIPLSERSPRDELSYFSKEPLEVGSLISVPLRRKNVPALVVRRTPIEERKADLKSSRFALRKIEKLKAVNFYDYKFIEAAKKIADYYCVSLGSVIASLSSKTVLENAGKLAEQSILSKKEDRGLPPEIFAIQAEDEERFADYRKMIRESFAKGKSVFVLVPTRASGERAANSLMRGIENYTIFLNVELTKKELLSRVSQSLSDSHPFLIIGTPSFLSLPSESIETLIVERENSRAYKTLASPYLDMRLCAEMIAREKKIRLVLGDLVLRLETLYRIEREEVSELGGPRARLPGSVRPNLIDMREEKKISKDSFPVLAEETKNKIRETVSRSEKVFLFTTRKGLSPLTVCSDCGSAVLCSRCEAPVVLHGRSGGNIFVCHFCGEKRDAAESCKNCKSWRLQTLGIGIELVEKEVKRAFPNIPVLRIDKDSVKNEKRAKEIVKKFYDTPGAILIGTELATFYLDKKVSLTAIISIDSLFAIPDFRIYERAFHTLVSLKFLSEKSCLYQTRNVSIPIFEYARDGAVSSFYRDEIETRESFSLPPFSLFIKMSMRGAGTQLKREVDRLSSMLVDFNPHTVQSSGKGRNQKIISLILQMKPSDWPQQELIRIIHSLPPSVKIQIDPDTLL